MAVMATAILRKTIAGWNRAAKGIPFVVLTDLDDADCAPSLVGDWLAVPKHPNLVFRVAVREVEAWLLGDTVHFAKFIGCAVDKMPHDPDTLPDPKRTLVDLASESRFADIRNRVVPKRGSTAQQGPDYNACLSDFVRGSWSSAESARRSPSLKSALTCFSKFEPTWT